MQDQRARAGVHVRLGDRADGSSIWSRLVWFVSGKRRECGCLRSLRASTHANVLQEEDERPRRGRPSRTWTCSCRADVSGSPWVGLELMLGDPGAQRQASDSRRCASRGGRVLRVVAVTVTHELRRVPRPTRKRKKQVVSRGPERLLHLCWTPRKLCWTSCGARSLKLSRVGDPGGSGAAGGPLGRPSWPRWREPR